MVGVNTLTFSSRKGWDNDQVLKERIKIKVKSVKKREKIKKKRGGKGEKRKKGKNEVKLIIMMTKFNCV